MSRFLVVGIDPGVTGAIAIHDGQGVLVEDLPVMAAGKGGQKVRNQINAAALAQFLRPYASEIKIAVVEQVSTMPGQGVASQGSIMRSLGCIEGVLAALGIPVEMVAPVKWKKAMGVTSDKEVSRAAAQRLYPDAPLARKKDHDRAEAILLATYGRKISD